MGQFYQLIILNVIVTLLYCYIVTLVREQIYKSIITFLI
jgi:hypothetical protein